MGSELWEAGRSSMVTVRVSRGPQSPRSMKPKVEGMSAWGRVRRLLGALIHPRE